MMVFVIIATAGFVFLALTLVFGEIFEFAGDVSHDIAIEHEISLDHPETGSPSLFSLKNMAAFMTGFGSSGAIASHYQFSAMGSSIIGLFFGLLTAIVVFFLVRAMFRQQAESGVTMNEMVGRTGVVTVEVPANGIGQVSLVIKGAQTEQFAVAEDSSKINLNASVKVIKIAGDKLFVRPV